MVETPPAPEERPETNRLSVSIDGIELPVDEDDREELLADIGQEVEEALAEKGLSTGETKVDSGHQYTEVLPDCPRCGTTLTVPRPFTIEEKLTSTAGMQVFCAECGYGGGATYRLVDIETNKLIRDRPPGQAAERYRSEVTDGKISPEYVEYHNG